MHTISLGSFVRIYCQDLTLREWPIQEAWKGRNGNFKPFLIASRRLHGTKATRYQRKSDAFQAQRRHHQSAEAMPLRRDAAEITVGRQHMKGQGTHPEESKPRNLLSISQLSKVFENATNRARVNLSLKQWILSERLVRTFHNNNEAHTQNATPKWPQKQKQYVSLQKEGGIIIRIMMYRITAQSSKLKN